MAKDKKPKKSDKSKKTAKSGKGEKKNKKTKGGVTKVALNAGKIATGILVEEIVAATLVAAAAAIRDPKKARAMASAAGSELKALTNEAAKEGSALWRLALDIAGKSLEFVGHKDVKDSAIVPKPRKPAVRQKRSAK